MQAFLAVKTIFHAIVSDNAAKRQAAISSILIITKAIKTINKERSVCFVEIAVKSNAAVKKLTIICADSSAMVVPFEDEDCTGNAP